MNIEEYITIGRKLSNMNHIQSVHAEGKGYFIIFKDWQKGGAYITIEQAKKIVKG